MRRRSWPGCRRWRARWSSCPPCCWSPTPPNPSSAAAANRSSWQPAPERRMRWGAAGGRLEGSAGPRALELATCWMLTAGQNFSDPIAATLIHRSAALQATIGGDAALFSAGTETHAVVLFKESRAADHAQVLVHYQLELAKRSGPGSPADHPRNSARASPGPGNGRGVPSVESGRPGGGGGPPAGGTGGQPRHRNLSAPGLRGRRSGGVGGRRLGLLPPSGGPRPEPRTAARPGTVLRQRRLSPGSGGQAASAPEQHLQPAGPDPAAARRRSAQGNGAAGTPRGLQGAALGRPAPDRGAV